MRGPIRPDGLHDMWACNCASCHGRAELYIIHFKARMRRRYPDLPEPAPPLYRSGED
jgi:hypothetical protein